VLTFFRQTTFGFGFFDMMSTKQQSDQVSVCASSSTTTTTTGTIIIICTAVKHPQHRLSQSEEDPLMVHRMNNVNNNMTKMTVTSSDRPLMVPSTSLSPSMIRRRISVQSSFFIRSVIIPFVVIFCTKLFVHVPLPLMAEKDSNPYPYGNNPNNQFKMYWNDAANVLQDLSKFSALFINYHGCVWSECHVDQYDDDGENRDGGNVIFACCLFVCLFFAMLYFFFKLRASIDD
jgi:hypothetical protein